MTRASELGWRGEEAVAAELRQRGVLILAQNFRVRGGEIDLVVRDGKTLVFIEVKTRLTVRFGKPEEAVDGRKYARMQVAGEAYLARTGARCDAVRFDVALVTWRDARPVIRYIRNVQ